MSGPRKVRQIRIRYRWVTALCLSTAFVPLVTVLSRPGPGESEGWFVLSSLALALVGSLGAGLHSARLAEAGRRPWPAGEPRNVERALIARELHDVVTHHVTAMVVQAEAARYLTAAPDRLEQNLTAVTGTGRQAIGDLHHLLALLDPDHRTRPAARTPAVADPSPSRNGLPRPDEW